MWRRSPPRTEERCCAAFLRGRRCATGLMRVIPIRSPARARYLPEPRSGTGKAVCPQTEVPACRAPDSEHAGVGPGKGFLLGAAQKSGTINGAPEDLMQPHGTARIRVLRMAIVAGWLASSGVCSAIAGDAMPVAQQNAPEASGRRPGTKNQPSALRRAVWRGRRSGSATTSSLSFLPGLRPSRMLYFIGPYAIE
jgi:hypothetical protein